jgi:hypothetical protein
MPFQARNPYLELLGLCGALVLVAPAPGGLLAPVRVRRRQCRRCIAALHIHAGHIVTYVARAAYNLRNLSLAGASAGSVEVCVCAKQLTSNKMSCGLLLLVVCLQVSNAEAAAVV